jgi:hypothetical protein
MYDQVCIDSSHIEPFGKMEMLFFLETKFDWTQILFE